MLTPRFELSQTDNEVTVVIHAPYANIKDTVVHVDGTDFRFYSTPYYLRLNLPGKIEENDASTGDYDCEKGDFTLKFSKVHKGEHFENLDMITTLLAPPKKKNNLVPTIEVISNPCATADENINDNKTNGEDENESLMMGDAGNEWYTKQNPLTESIDISLHSPKYGFANKISGALGAFEDGWIKEIVDLPLPDKTLLEDRKKLREQHELESFNEEHYMADLVESDSVKPYLTYECEWDKLAAEDVQLTGEEKDLLKELPNKEYLLDENEIKTALYSMIDILFASCYNCRTTLGDNTVESGWTINKLSSTLSWFQSFTNLNDVILSNIKRSLCYPLVRNWDLSMKVFEDVKKVVKLGKKYIMKRFCEIHSLFNNSYEPRYILNQLYIKDYLIWLQQVPNSKIEELNSVLDSINPKKEELGLDLIELEEAAYSVQKEDLVIENELYTLPEDMEKLIINNENNKPENVNPQLSEDTEDSDSDSSSSSSSTSSSSTSSSSSSNSSSSSSSNSKIIHMNNSSNNSTLDSDDEPN
ncbi:hypothetical protein TSAR_012220 [Trichomalopsis sarcophagae]|uniref:Protein SHQ1 homolog n=1 Tax=Trichomalopsis sarcophagae TaxID=543379 RepID=A0A232EF33_9HYME|nr:hypothetical protein TSAR_012220 [Trichomalopsis sarcophagae]